MDRITKSLLAEFVEQNDLSKLDEDQAFEHFTGTLAVGQHYYERFEPEEIVVGAGGDSGIDCIAILANGALVTEPEEIADLSENNKHLDVAFIFVQAERSSSFDSAKIGQFAFGVRDFLSEHPQLVQNTEIQHASAIAKEVFDRSTLFKKGNPTCHLYYSTTGKWVGDKNLIARRDAERATIVDTGLFREVTFSCLGADELQRMYRESQNAVSQEIQFSKKVVVPELAGVEQAYVGLLTAPEFLKLIENDSGDAQAALFYDNVRHWQEWTPVNSEMRKTLEDPASRLLFPLLNNGVTVVARRVNPTGDKFQVEDYQIVNGCQTSFVLHACRDLLGEDVLVPVRLIATSDENIRNSIIKATNRQTPITDEQLVALSDFPKKLESFFPTYGGSKQLFYERRSRQYGAVSGIEKTRIITMAALIRSFAAIFRSVPHRTTRNYKALLREVGKEIFGQDHRLEPYYSAAYAHYRLEFMFRNGHLATELKPARYQVLLAARLLWRKGPIPKMNSKEMIKYCNDLNDVLWDDDACRTLFIKAGEIVKEIAGGSLNRDEVRTDSFTNQVLQRLDPLSGHAAAEAHDVPEAISTI